MHRSATDVAMTASALLAYLISQVLVSVWEIPVLFDVSPQPSRGLPVSGRA